MDRVADRSTVAAATASSTISTAPAARCRIPGGSISSGIPITPGSRFRINAVLSSALNAEIAVRATVIALRPVSLRCRRASSTPAAGSAAKTTAPAYRCTLEEKFSGVPRRLVGKIAAISRATAQAASSPRSTRVPVSWASPRASIPAPIASAAAVIPNSGIP